MNDIKLFNQFKHKYFVKIILYKSFSQIDGEKIVGELTKGQIYLLIVIININNKERQKSPFSGFVSCPVVICLTPHCLELEQWNCYLPKTLHFLHDYPVIILLYYAIFA